MQRHTRAEALPKKETHGGKSLMKMLHNAGKVARAKGENSRTGVPKAGPQERRPDFGLIFCASGKPRFSQFLRPGAWKKSKTGKASKAERKQVSPLATAFLSNADPKRFRKYSI